MTNTNAAEEYADARTKEAMQQAEEIVAKCIDAVPEYALVDVMQLLDVARVRAFMRLYDIQHRNRKDMDIHT